MTDSTVPNSSPFLKIVAFSGGKVDENDVSELVLGIVGDADSDDVALKLDPFVFFGVTSAFGKLQFTYLFHNVSSCG